MKYNARGKGKVIGEFVCDKVSPFYYGNMDYPIPTYDGDDSVCEIGDGYYITSGELVETCLTYEQIENYGKSKTLYGLHISDLKIYYTLKELGEFNGFKKCAACKVSGYEVSACIHDENCMIPVPLTRPPQSWCYVEELSE